MISKISHLFLLINNKIELEKKDKHNKNFPLRGSDREKPVDSKGLLREKIKASVAGLDMTDPSVFKDSVKIFLSIASTDLFGSDVLNNKDFQKILDKVQADILADADMKKEFEQFFLE